MWTEAWSTVTGLKGGRSAVVKLRGGGPAVSDERKRWADSGQAWEVAAVAVRCRWLRWQFELSGRAGSGSVSVRST
jgi:hypothetical protein